MPSQTITLKNFAGTNVVYTLISYVGNTATYAKQGASLLDSSRLLLQLKENGATNRIVGKLSIPTVGVIPATGQSGVLWKEVGSLDLSSVLGASSDAAKDFAAQFASLAGSDAVKNLYTLGMQV